MNTDGLIHQDLSERIIGCAMTVHNSLKPGLREKTYERALVHELAKNGLKTDQQRHFDVTYDGKVIDTLIPDLIVARECFQTTRRGLTTDASPNGCALKSPPPNRLRFWFRGAANRRCEQKENSILCRRLADPRNPPRSRSGGALPVAEPLGDASVVKTGLVVLCLRRHPHRPNHRLPIHHRASAGSVDQFQARPSAMEAHRPVTSSVPIRVIRGKKMK